MKYLYFIAGIILAASLALALQLIPSPGKVNLEEEVALVVNDHAITSKELAAAELLQPGRDGAESTVDSVITRELLIQEAKRRGIDREEDFRASIKNFYEQSLVKILLDRQGQQLHNDVTDDHVERYLQLLGATVELTMFRPQTNDLLDNSTEEHLLSRFADLSEDLRCRLAGLKPGERSEPDPSNKDGVSYRLDRVEPLPEGDKTPRDMIRRLLEDFHKRQLMNSWLNELRNKAMIKVLIRNQSPEK